MPGYLRTIGVAGAAALALAVAASAQSTPDPENGRYTFTPTADGVLRLDTRSGSIASCNNRVAGWSCYVVPDERAALDVEVGKLTRENTQLKDDLARLKEGQARFDRDIVSTAHIADILFESSRCIANINRIPVTGKHHAHLPVYLCNLVDVRFAHDL